MTSESEKANARSRVQQALKVGSLIRGKCDVCGSDDTEAHHDDYAKALEVRWLCHYHHVGIHYPDTLKPAPVKSEVAQTLRAQRKGRNPQPCAVCGTMFKQMERKQVYCSSQCRYRARANRKGRVPRQPVPTEATS